MENNKLVPKEWFMEKHEFTWKIANFAKIRNSKQGLELQHFDFEAGSSIEVASKWRCFLKLGKNGRFDVLRPDIKLVGAIPENANFLTVVVFRSKCGKTIRGKADQYQTSQESILDLIQKVNLLVHPLMHPDGSLTVDVQFYICNLQRIPPQLSHNALMVSSLTWFYETQFINKWQADFRTMYKQSFDGGHNLGVKLITKDDREFVANRAILGVRSPVFRSMFQTPMFEAQEGVVKIDDISGPTFEALLSFMYTGKLPENWKEPEILEEFIYGAHKYMLEDLQQFFERTLVFLCSDEEEEGNNQNLKQLADMLNIKMEKDWSSSLQNFVKDCLGGSAVIFMFKELKLKEMEPRLLLAFMGAMIA